MLSFILRRKRNAIPEAYRKLDKAELTRVAGGGVLDNIWPGSGGQGAMKDPNG